MEFGFVEQILDDVEFAIIKMDNHKTLSLPKSLLPYNIRVDDFVIIDQGQVKIDPDNDKKRAILAEQIKNLIESNKK